ncbi:2-oxoglutarate dehydrogenase E1 component [Paenalkalicoccus suaedae]|uniref:2-oxoglutarate dehydrogenase E1 component n=1 Tax=Paenalkalicoccus suaedae TaxID=2592382 RepID=A0A859FE65_9BACI|nr:2-oxoglutarate dehydrogenase E1 component [Paenalkalicoccus suaedae]QKS71170.1 2-oxoglutarate dehydrogenase E1 component [Paenalkalicoccus suaedae]
MGSQSISMTEGWDQFYGPNLGYMLEQYEKYQQDEPVDDEIIAFFDMWGAYEEQAVNGSPALPVETQESSKETYYTAISAMNLADFIRRNGHIMSDIVPVTDKVKEDIFKLEDFNLTEDSLNKVPAELLSPYKSVKNGVEAITHLKNTYTKKLAFEFKQVQNIDERNWLFEMVESGNYLPEVTDKVKQNLLTRLNEVEGFEHFIHKTFKGQKRFSIEGLEAMVPMLDEAVREAANDGAENIMIGMAHRGRLNVLAHVLNKPYEIIFSEFHDAPNKELVPSEGSVGLNYGWTGDVKYHLGADREIDEVKEGVTVTLANNPSHLEFVDPVVEGLARAAQDDRSQKGFPLQDKKKSMPILIHGDAAFPGQGIVAETLNLSQLEGYSTGGTIHLIANNMIGFTTVSGDSRSTKYASDLAKGFEVPVIHVNADDPEACLAAIHLAYLYRREFHKDIVIDLIGYRRYGHNEMDEPMTTQPQLYTLIKDHPTVFNLYGQKLVKDGVVSEDDFSSMRETFTKELEQYFTNIKDKKRTHIDDKMLPPDYVATNLYGMETKITAEELTKLNKELLDFPDDFHIFPKLQKILERRTDALEADGKVDWGHAETLAFASILQDGTPIRLSGQDSQRGTFSQRHLMLHDYKEEGMYSPLHVMPSAKASFAVHNSPLSEAAVVGFEYGYNVHSPETLTLWEAQYGDFSNGAQVLFDQFISSGRAKWGQKSGLVLLLPHGYEGQGPEHSSARLERFLTLAAENNWHVANLTKASQYFHLLRRQAKLLTMDEVRPLVLMAPKSLLRNERVASSVEELSEGRFNPIIVNETLGKKKTSVKRVILATGKMAIDLTERIEQKQESVDFLQQINIEELYPFPKEQIAEVLKQYKNLEEVIWVQEEPQNMGAWNYIAPHLQDVAPEKAHVSFIGRKRRSSTAEGDPKVHKIEQTRIIEEATTHDAEGSNE